MQHQLHFTIDERSQIGGARRAALELAEGLGFGDEQAGKAALAVTECATNILKHATRGELLLRQLRGSDKGGLEIIALDRGPGIADLNASLRDGHSTSGTIGGGLGALSRMSGRFDVFTRPGKGTALRLELWPPGAGPPVRTIEYGGISVAKAGESVCGDAWGVELWRDQALVVLADGLGHGLNAHEASRATTDVLAAHPEADPHTLLMMCHDQLARTRGAAVAACRVMASDERGAFAGVGNIAARVETASGNRQLVSYNGIVGHTVRKLQEFSFPWPKGALLVLHSDGLGTHWHLQDYPGLASRHPALIAAVLYRDYDRHRDDASVVVLRNQQGAVAGSG